MDAIFSIAIIYLVSATETLGDASALTGGTLHRELTKDETTGVLTIDGFGSVLSGLLGGTPVTSYSENVGLTIMTKVVNRHVARLGGVIMILAGFFPPVFTEACRYACLQPVRPGVHLHSGKITRNPRGSFSGLQVCLSGGDPEHFLTKRGRCHFCDRAGDEPRAAPGSGLNRSAP